MIYIPSDFKSFLTSLAGRDTVIDKSCKEIYFSMPNSNEWHNNASLDHISDFTPTWHTHG